jgi:hypothetical membrane protein
MALGRRDWQRISGVALVLGPTQFAIATLVEGALIPGYGLITHWISDLGAPPNQTPPFAPGTSLWWLFSASLILMSLLIFLGLVGLQPLLGGRLTGKLTLVIIAVVALGGVGVAVWNEVDALEMHSISALIAFGLGWVAMVLFGLYARSSPLWKGAWAPWSILGGSVSLGALALYIIPTFLGRANVPEWMASIYPGGSERLIVLPLILWMVALGAQMLRGFGEASGSATPSVV